jgi:hypothetical protein
MQPCNEPTPQQPILLSLRDMTEILIKHNNFHEGLYELTFEFKISVGAFGPEPKSVYPGAIMGISRVGISKTSIEKINTVDAAKVNPLVKPSRKKELPVK